MIHCNGIVALRRRLRCGADRITCAVVNYRQNILQKGNVSRIALPLGTHLSQSILTLQASNPSLLQHTKNMASRLSPHTPTPHQHPTPPPTATYCQIQTTLNNTINSEGNTPSPLVTQSSLPLLAPESFALIYFGTRRTRPVGSPPHHQLICREKRDAQCIGIYDCTQFSVNLFSN